MGQVAIYCRVSSDDQSCERQERDLRAFAKRASHKIVAVFKETASGADNARSERAKVLALARARKIDAILVTELNRWGRSTQALVQTPDDLYGWKVSVLAQTGLSFDLSTSSGKLTGPLTLECGGPRMYSNEELLRTIARAASVKPFLLPVPFVVWHALALVAQVLSGAQSPAIRWN